MDPLVSWPSARADHGGTGSSRVRIMAAVSANCFAPESAAGLDGAPGVAGGDQAGERPVDEARETMALEERFEHLPPRQEAGLHPGPSRRRDLTAPEGPELVEEDPSVHAGILPGGRDPVSESCELPAQSSVHHPLDPHAGLATDQADHVGHRDQDDRGGLGGVLSKCGEKHRDGRTGEARRRSSP